jgi:hypothetical protein
VVTLEEFSALMMGQLNGRDPLQVRRWMDRYMIAGSYNDA